MSTKKCTTAGCTKWEFADGQCKEHYAGPPVSSGPPKTPTGKPEGEKKGVFSSFSRGPSLKSQQSVTGSGTVETKGLLVGEGKAEYRVTVVVIQGRHLVSKDLRGSSDPFVKITTAGKTVKTEVLKTTLAPIWKQKFEFVSVTRPLEILFECLDWNRVMSSAPMGSVKVDLRPYWADPEKTNGEYRWLPLALEGLKNGGTAGDIQVQITCTDKPLDAPIVYSEFSHLIELTIVSGAELTGDLVGNADAYVEVEWGGKLYRTTAVQNSANPQWNQSIFLWLNQNTQSNYKIAFTVKDEDYSHDHSTGFAYLPIQDVLTNPNDVARELPLLARNLRTDADLGQARSAGPATPTAKLGKIHIQCRLHKKDEIEKKFFDQLITEFGQLSADTESARNTLDSAEASFMFDTIGITMTEAMFDHMDRDKNGVIDRAELSNYLSSAEAQKSADLGKLLIHMRNKDDSAMNCTLMEGFTRKAPVGQISVRDLESGNIVFENIPGYIKAALHVMSDTKLSRLATAHARNLMSNLSKKQGIKYDNPASAHEIPHFVKLHGLDLNEVELKVEQYKTFNEFFARKLRAGARPIDTPDDATRACSPADARMMVFADVTTDCGTWIKGAKFTVENLLGAEGKEYVGALQGGSMVIARLAPQDYHRWHVPVGGVLGPKMPIAGALYTVNPIAINHAVNVYTENKRCLIPIQSPDFGLVMLVAVGAIMVGSIVIDVEDAQEGMAVKKGHLHGYFKFGGSTVLILFQKNRIKFRDELLANSKENIESLIKCGQFLGTATQPNKQA